VARIAVYANCKTEMTGGWDSTRRYRQHNGKER